MIYFTTDQIQNLELIDSHHLEEQLNNFGFSSPAIVELIKATYSYCTNNEMSIEQKQALLNLILGLVYEIPELQTEKCEFVCSFNERIEALAKRSPSRLNPVFELSETDSIVNFFKSQVLPYYELYEFVLDSRPLFNLVTKEFNPIVNLKEPPIFEGQVVDVEQVEVMKEFIGVRTVKEEKKDSKKK